MSNLSKVSKVSRISNLSKVEKYDNIVKKKSELSRNLSVTEFVSLSVKFKFFELLTQLKIWANKVLG